jgi:hypothetical protein
MLQSRSDMGTSGTESADALDLLAHQHRRAIELVAQLRSASPDRRLYLLFELADYLAADAAMEETLLFPAMRARACDDGFVDSAVEHRVLKRMLADMLGADLGEARFDAHIDMLETVLRRHAVEVETRVFPVVRRVMSVQELLTIGIQMRALQAQLVTQREPAVTRAHGISREQLA